MPVTMKAPQDCGGISFAGVSYTPSKKGLVKVPDEAVAELLNFGFTVAPPEDSMDQESADAFLVASQAQAAFEAGLQEKQALDDAEAKAQEELRAQIDKAEGK